MPLTYALYAYCGALTLWALITTIVNRPAGKALLTASAGLFGLLIIQLITSVVLFHTAPSTDPILFYGYIITALVLVVLVTGWAFIELTRWGAAVIAAGALTVIVMVERMSHIWQ